jgi:hypothetical protein
VPEGSEAAALHRDNVNGVYHSHISHILLPTTLRHAIVRNTPHLRIYDFESHPPKTSL